MKFFISIHELLREARLRYRNTNNIRCFISIHEFLRGARLRKYNDRIEAVQISIHELQEELDSVF